MRAPLLRSFIIVLLASGCIDRISIPIETPSALPVVVDGFITDSPGPYTVNLTRTYDVESKSSTRVPISGAHVQISDNVGNTENLAEVNYGVYQTRPGGIVGRVGRIYKLKLEFLDGSIYESIPDTLREAGSVDSVYSKLRIANVDGIMNYSFDVYFDASTSRKNYNLLWKFVGTYRAEIPCCTCWAFLKNPIPLLSNDELVADGKFKGIKAYNVLVTGWTFMHKTNVRIEQYSLSTHAFAFWKEVKNQLEASGSLFQPVTGKISQTFVQIAGTPADVYGIFYASSIVSKSIYITPQDLPNPNLVPKIEISPATSNYDPTLRLCKDWFPGSTAIKPSYWID